MNIIDEAEKRINQVDDKEIIRELLFEIRTLREEIHRIRNGETIYFLTNTDGNRSMVYSLGKPSANHVAFVRIY